MILILVLLGLLSCVPVVIRKMKSERHRLLLASQLRQSLYNMVHALKVGVGFMQALEYAAKEGAAPLALEWQRTLQAVRLGQSLSDAMEELAGRVPIKEMRWFTTAIQITQTTGGSLADVLDTLANSLQEQQTLREKVGALTAQGKASGALLGLLPFLMMGILYLVDPTMMLPLFKTSTGQSIIAGVTVSVAIGGAIIKKIVTVKVD